MIPHDTLNVLNLTAAGTTQSDATAISANFSPAMVVAAGNDLVGVRLPAAARGKVYFVKNIGTAGITSKLNVYPATGDLINTLATNAAYQMTQLTSCIFVAANSTTWYSFDLIAS